MNSIKFNGNLVIPPKVICVGRNFVEHIKELNNEMPGQMVIFNKPNSAISSELKFFSESHRFEGELCFLIKGGEIAGVGFGLDITDKKAQDYAKQKGLPWERAKAFDGSAVFSEFIEFNGDINALSFKLYINGKLQQHGNIELMIHKPQEILKEIQSFQTLQDYSIIMTGTPKGVDSYKAGDEFKTVIYENGREILSCAFKALL